MHEKGNIRKEMNEVRKGRWIEGENGKDKEGMNTRKTVKRKAERKKRVWGE